MKFRIDREILYSNPKRPNINDLKMNLSQHSIYSYWAKLPDFNKRSVDNGLFPYYAGAGSDSCNISIFSEHSPEKIRQILSGIIKKEVPVYTPDHIIDVSKRNGTLMEGILMNDISKNRGTSRKGD
ncbi:MAG: hypothetical protein A2Y40_01630 [Candidatus Margulisbacteria bacterium GWF2_35_9]|nr:MAG: hypothetical protein A2Y40_01630 [Candidatus Margulisbacteria bacterium GWF2_35_9]